MNNTYLEKGKYEIRVSSNSNSNIDLDSIVIYSTSDTNGESNNSSNYGNNQNDSSINDEQRYEPIENPFNSNLDDGSSRAYIEKYEKVDPTRFEVDIRNATRPYIMSFAESYDPLWVAYVDDSSFNPNDFKIRSVPLYSTVNGFYINRTGDYSLVIEYEPQKWFSQAGIVSVAALSLSIIALLIQERKLKWHSYTKSINSFSFTASRILGLKHLRFWRRDH